MSLPCFQPLSSFARSIANFLNWFLYINIDAAIYLKLRTGICSLVVYKLPVAPGMGSEPLHLAYKVAQGFGLSFLVQ